MSGIAVRARLLAAATTLGARALAAQPATVTNAIGMEFVTVPAGSMVVARYEPSCPRPASWTERDVLLCESLAARDRSPGFTARIARPFQIGKHEVTQAEWTRVMGSNPSHFKGDRLPVDNVTWEDARAFARRLSAMDTTARYRLPTELEWEWAARAGADSEPSWPQIRASAWIQDIDKGSTHPVGTKAPNAWGLHDTLGNVWEWVEDLYNERWFPDPAPPRRGTTHVLRGGSFLSDVKNATWFTHAGGPGSGFDVGFRVVRVPR
jgi:formylglycine-generating enzyme